MAPGAGGPMSQHMPVRGRYGATRGHNVETSHPVETFPADRRFYFHPTKSFRVNGGGQVRTPGPLSGRAVLNGITPPLG